MTVFISYSHKDEVEKDELVGHLSVLEQSEHAIDLWVDDRIGAGADWAAEIDAAMSRATVAILLVTKNFLTSKFIRDTEAPRLLQRRRQEGVVVFPVIARPCAWQRVPWLAAMNVRPKNGTPVWREGGRYADEALAAIAYEVADILEKAGPPAGPLKAPAGAGPQVYLHAFGQPPQTMPPGAHQLDWRAYFDSSVSPRRVPGPEVWQKTLLPQLQALQQALGPGQAIHLHGSASLAAGFALGQTFKEVGRYQLTVAQFSDGEPQSWRSNQKPPAGAEPPGLVEHTLPGNPEAGDAAVIVFANPRQVLSEVVASVGAYWGEGEIFARGLSGQTASRKLKGGLVLAAAAAAGDKRPLTNWETVALAQTISEPLRRFAGRVKPTKLHLFMAAPLAMAAFMGHYWNALGKPVQCYEWVGGEPVYAPAYTLAL